MAGRFRCGWVFCVITCRIGFQCRRWRKWSLQVTEAHLKHGGGGAYYVYLRRSPLTKVCALGNTHANTIALAKTK